MKPADLQPTSFDRYPPLARRFAIDHLGLLRQLPLSVCPSFLVQIAAFDTRFPSERRSLQWQCDHLQTMAPAAREALLTPLRELSLPVDLERSDWVNASTVFVERLSAHLWSSGQINGFHDASRRLFQQIGEPPDTSSRLLLIVLGKGANPARPSILRRLASRGVTLQALQAESASRQLLHAFAQRARQQQAPYAHWYVDGGQPWPLPETTQPSVVRVSYPHLAPRPLHVVARMRAVFERADSGAEQMRSRMAATDPSDLTSERIIPDPVLQRFYTELFTESSGPQIFSTSFVQWTGRELARRVQPATLLLRYAPRQQHRGLNEMVSGPEPTALDPEASLVDAEMGAFYNWIEMNRVTAEGRLTVLAWVEDSARAVVVSAKAPAGTVSSRRITVEEALAAYGTP